MPVIQAFDSHIFIMFVRSCFFFLKKLSLTVVKCKTGCSFSSPILYMKSWAVTTEQSYDSLVQELFDKLINLFVMNLSPRSWKTAICALFPEKFTKMQKNVEESETENSWIYSFNFDLLLIGPRYIIDSLLWWILLVDDVILFWLGCNVEFILRESNVFLSASIII